MICVTHKRKFLAQFCLTIFILSTAVVILNLTIGKPSSQGIMVDNNLSYQALKENKYPITYTIMDRYATGETVIRGSKNSMDIGVLNTYNEEVQQPLSKFATNLLGGDEMCVMYNWWGGPYGNYINHYSDSRFLDSSSLKLDLLKKDNMITSTFSDTSEFAYGDFDGNFKQDIVVASLFGSRLKLQILENWGDKGMHITAETNSSNLWDCDSLHTVTTGDFDGDKLDEFAVLGIRDSIPQLWIFEDLVNSHPQQFVNYGERIMLKASQSPNHFVRSYSAPHMSSDNIIESNAINDETIQFTIEKYGARNHTGVVQYGDAVIFRDHQGYYWTDFDLGKLESRVLPQITGGDPSEAPQNQFTILSDRSGAPGAGVVHYNDFVSFQSSKGEYVRNDMIFAANNDEHHTWFKLTKNDSLPLTFKTQDLIPIETIQFDDCTSLDILPAIPDEKPATTSVTSCNLDTDDQEELVLIGMDQSGWARAWVIDDASNDFDTLHQFSWVDQIQNVHLNVQTGNVDEDQQDEIIFALTKNNFGEIYIYDDEESSISYSLLKKISGDSALHGILTQITSGDIDGDGVEEIIFAQNTSSLLKIWDDSSSNFTHIGDFDPWSDKTGNYIPQDLTTGDLDIDGTEEILITSQFTIPYLGSSVGVIDYNGTIFRRTNEDRYSGTADGLKVLAGDFAGDQFTVKYLAHDLYTSDEQIIAVMAAPPTQAGISQNYDDSSTAYGEGKSSSGSQKWGASASFGAYFGLEIEVTAGFLVSLKIAKIETEFALISETSITHTVTQTTAHVATFTTDASYNYVVFSTCVYDRFDYEILDAPDPSLIGKNYSLHIPNTPTVEKWDIEYYNSHNSVNAPDIGSETFSHTVGYVTSYPTKEKMASIAPVRMETATIAVGKGGATIGQEIDLSTETEVELETSLTFEWKVGAGSAAVVGIMGSIGALGGHTWGWGEETMFSCEIGDIENDDDFANFRYTCGLFVYIKEYRPKATEDWLSSLGDLGELASDFLKDVSTLGLDSFSRGEGYYVLNYWVDVPLGWGQGAIDAREYADDVVELLTDLDLISAIAFYPIIFILPGANLWYLRRKGGK